MRWSPIIFELVLVVALWAAVLWLMRQRGVRVAANASPQATRGHRLYTEAVLCVTVGLTLFVAWLITDSLGPHWLHVLSLPAALVSIAAGALVAGYAGWVAGP